MAQVLFLNAPANSGKDTIADALVEQHGFTKLSFKDTLFDFMFKIFNIKDSAAFMDMYYTRVTKEQPCELLRLGGAVLSPRQALIHVSENVVKPLLGDDYFGQAVLAKIKPSGKYVFSDCGFLEEIMPIIQKVMPFNVYLVRLTREGCTFNGDSRNYIYPKLHGIKCVKELDVANAGTVDDVVSNIMDFFNEVEG